MFRNKNFVRCTCRDGWMKLHVLVNQVYIQGMTVRVLLADKEYEQELQRKWPHFST